MRQGIRLAPIRLPSRAGRRRPAAAASGADIVPAAGIAAGGGGGALPLLQFPLQQVLLL